MTPKAIVVGLFRKAKEEGRVHKYRKVGTVLARLASPGEIVTTVIDGVKETTNIAGKDSIVVRNTSGKGEFYVLTKNKFYDRYKADGPISTKWTRASPTGTCWAFEYVGEPFTFMAPWNEPMIVESGDFIAVNPKNEDDIYRIEKNVFRKTYKKMNYHL